MTNACRIRRGNFYFDRGMTPPPKSVCKRKPSRSRPGGEARCFYRPSAADLGSKGLIIQILKFRNVSVTHECICLQLDTSGSVDLIKYKLFLILMSIFFFLFLSNHSKIKTTHAFMLHHPAVCSVYINARIVFFPKLIKNTISCKFVPQNKLLPLSDKLLDIS